MDRIRGIEIQAFINMPISRLYWYNSVTEFSAQSDFTFQYKTYMSHTKAKHFQE